MRPDRLHNGGPPVDDDAEGNTYNVHRQTHEHWLVGAGQPVDPADPSRGAYSRFEAWTDFIRTARWKPVTINFYGQQVTLERGELVGGYPVLAQRWNWTYKRVRLFVEKLLDEGMIGISPTSHADHETRNQQHSVKTPNQDTPQGRQHGNRALILMLCNYDKYQYAAIGEGQATGQATGQARGRRGAGEGHEIERRKKEGRKKEEKTTSSESKLHPLSAASAADAADDLFEGLAVKPTETQLTEAKRAYNDAAQAHGFAVCRSWTSARESLLERRLRDIGGVGAFKQALTQIPFDSFLMGQRPGRDGQSPFRLDIDCLLSTKSGLGDVLAKLADRAGQASAAVSRGEPARVGPNGKKWGWWRGSEDKSRLLSADDWRRMLDANRPNGEWPWWNLGAPPGHAECLLPADVLAEGNLVDKYRGRVMARQATETAPVGASDVVKLSG